MPVLFPCREEMYYKAVHNTAVLFLQNSAGFAKWEPTPERLQELVAAYKHSGRTLSSSSSSSSSSSQCTAGNVGMGETEARDGDVRGKLSHGTGSIQGKLRHGLEPSKENQGTTQDKSKGN